MKITFDEYDDFDIYQDYEPKCSYKSTKKKNRIEKYETKERNKNAGYRKGSCNNKYTMKQAPLNQDMPNPSVKGGEAVEQVNLEDVFLEEDIGNLTSENVINVTETQQNSQECIVIRKNTLEFSKIQDIIKIDNTKNDIKTFGIKIFYKMGDVPPKIIWFNQNETERDNSFNLCCEVFNKMKGGLR